MKRFVLLVLLSVLPLQMTWAGVATCPPGEHHGAAAAARDDASDPDDAHRHGDALYVHDAHPHGDTPHALDAHPHGDASDGHGTSGHAGGPGFDCSLFHFVAVEPPSSAPRSPPSRGSDATPIALTGHESHIPDGLERPQWRPAASFGETFPF